MVIFAFTVSAFAASSQGDQGNQGNKSSQGSQGDQGNKTGTGTQGSQGDQGNQGSQGDQGGQGDQGNQGSQGDQGGQGDQGSQGDQGGQGNQGDQGNHGSQGDQGGQGDQGNQNDQGNQGNQGDQGNQNDQGNRPHKPCHRKTRYYTVIFDANGGVLTSSARARVASGRTVASPSDPTWDGYLFVGWYVDEAGDVPYDFDLPVKANFTLYAKWTPAVTLLLGHLVIFDSQGGSYVPSMGIDEGALVIKPADPTRDGYTFTGWYKDSECTEAWDFVTGIMGTADITLYAGWVKQEDPIIHKGDPEVKPTIRQEIEPDPIVPLADLPTTTGMPLTGDTISAGSLVASLLVAATAGSGAVIFRKRRNA